MRDLSACFGEHAVQVADASSSSTSSRTGNNSMTMQNLVTCLYQTMLSGESRLITVTWCKNLMGQGLSVNVDDPSCQCMCRVDMKSWFFWKKKGSKRFDLGATKVDVFWDLSAAKYGSGPEPLEGYFLAVVSDQEVALLLGDMGKEAFKRTNATGPPGDTVLISRKEHVCGKNFYSTKAQFCDKGRAHDIVIECQTEGPREPRLSIRIDKQLVVQVKHLLWKFRGNQSILVDGLPVEMFWDVHDWFFSPSAGHAVFLFRTCLSNEEPWHKLNSYSFKQKESQAQGLGFSLVLYAWKNE